MSAPTMSSSLLFFAQSFKSKQVPLPVEDCCALAALTLALLLFCPSVYVSEDVFVCARLLRLRWPCFLSIWAFTLQELSPCKTEGVCAGTSFFCLSFLCRRLLSFIHSLLFSAAAAAWVLPAVDTECKLQYMHTLQIDTHTGTYSVYNKCSCTYTHIEMSAVFYCTCIVHSGLHSWHIHAVLSLYKPVYMSDDSFFRPLIDSSSQRLFDKY